MTISMRCVDGLAEHEIRFSVPHDADFDSARTQVLRAFDAAHALIRDSAGRATLARLDWQRRARA